MVLKPFSLTGELNLTGAPVAHYAPYYSKALPGANIESGLLSANAQYTLALPDDAPLHLELKAPSLLLEQFALRDLQEKQPFVQIERLGLNELSLQLAQHQLHIGQIHSQGAKFSLATDEKGGLTALRILKSPDNHPAQTHAKPSNTKAEAPSAPWTWQIQNVDFSKWALKFEERSSGKPVQLALDDWALHLEGLSSKTEAPLKLNTQAQFNKTGRIQTEGTVRLEPILKTQLKLDTTNIDLSPFRPYADKAMRMAITKGKLNARSHIDLAFEKTGLKGHVSGDFGVIGFASRDTINDADFVQWQQLSLENLDLTLSPLAINLEEVKLNGLVSRLILSEKGRLNLRELPAQEDSPPPDAATPAPTQDNKAASTPPADKPSTPKLALKVNKISLNDANIIYSDRFIKPNFDVDVRQFSGQLTGLESLPDKIAKLNFSGRVDGSAPLKLEGEFNPFRDDLKLDIRASVQDYELTGISAYTGKYVGYGIQKGKLSADLGYKIEDRKLSATNKIKLNQLTFGDAVQSPDAMNLPVQLAVTLLADRNGVIDLSLPVTGALDDPQFSIAGVVWQAFTNIISKALTAPFTLLGNIFSGGGEDSAPILNFAPGAETLASTESEKLEKLAQALKDRPSLKVEITGIAHSTEDLNGLRTRWLNDKMQHFYTQELQDKGMNAEEAEKQTFPENEKSRLLKRVYRDADFKKPRSLIGLTKDIPPDEMEKLIINNAPVKEENLHNLAKARAQVVKEQLDKAGVSGEQLFLTEPKVEPSSSTDAGRVQFALKK